MKILHIYREKREKNNKKYLGKEVLLIGSLTAFMAQGIIGLFLFNRTINGMALLTFIFLGSLVLAHAVTIQNHQAIVHLNIVMITKTILLIEKM